MLENDVDVAAYRDAVLWYGVVVRLTPAETMAVCKHVLSAGTDVATRRLIAHGLFVIDDKTGTRGGALLAVPRNKRCVDAVSEALRSSELKAASRRILKAART